MNLVHGIGDRTNPYNYWTKKLYYTPIEQSLLNNNEPRFHTFRRQSTSCTRDQHSSQFKSELTLRGLIRMLPIKPLKLLTFTVHSGTKQTREDLQKESTCQLERWPWNNLRTNLGQPYNIRFTSSATASLSKISHQNVPIKSPIPTSRRLFSPAL